MTVTRRQVLRSAGALLPAIAALSGGAGWSFADAPELLIERQPFAEDHVRKLAEALAAEPWQDVRIAMPPGWENLTYDQYRDIRFNPEKSLWKGEPHRFSFDLFHSGFLFTAPVDVHIVENGQAARIAYSPELFTFGPQAPTTDGKTDLHYAGFRLRYPINTPDYDDEFVVFQGASYFRGVGKGLLYGLSARGLAIATGQPGGEEFPMFRAFWVRKPDPAATTVVVEALLDSPSVTGAYKFSIKPGDDTQMDVELVLFPRRDLPHVGIAPMTSMFLLDPLSKPVDDFRPSVHDSDGLMMHTGAGEWLWRPLANPKTLQVSAFIDQSPRGFGLMQRKRSYRDFLDLESRYERRPSLWAEPVGDWGPGAVELYEIPTEIETNDNIVAFWQPKEPLKQGQSYAFVYRLHWCADWPLEGDQAVARTVFSGSGVDPDYAASPPSYDPDLRLYIVEFAGGDLSGELTPEVTASAGVIGNVHAARNEMANTTRLSFEHNVSGADLSELRAVLKRGATPVSETWLFRWTRR
jgi:glucans biosynthesis protein